MTYLDLSGSENLKNLPELDKMVNLETLILDYCPEISMFTWQKTMCVFLVTVFCITPY